MKPIVCLLVSACALAQTPVVPQKSAFYYSYPSGVNGTFAVAPAAAVFSAYDRVVFGDTLEAPTHPDHANAVAIIATAPLTEFWGYVSIGVSTVNLTPADIQLRINQWAAMGVRGIFFDEAGYDYGVTRARQNAVVDVAHAAGLHAWMNAWIPADVFDPAVQPLNGVGGGNPTGLPCHLGATDRYLMESFVIENGGYQAEAFAFSKADAALAYRAAFGTKIECTTTTIAAVPFSQPDCDLAWFTALLYGCDGFSWGEPIFAAPTGLLPFRARPNVGTLGTTYLSGVIHAAALSRHSRLTNTGHIVVDHAARAGGFRSASWLGPSVVTIGATTSWTLDATGSAALPYVVALSESTQPGITLVDGRTLALADGALFQLSLAPNPLMVAFTGAVDGAGQAHPQITLPAAPQLAGIAFQMVAAVLDFGDPSAVRTFTAPRALTIN